MRLFIFVVTILLVATAVSLAGTSARAQEVEVPEESVDAPDVTFVDMVAQDAPTAIPLVESVPPDAPTPTPLPTPTVAPTPVASPTAAPVAARLAANVIDNRFQPTALSVAVGTTVTWTNQGSNTHTLHGLDGQLESGPLIAGQSYSFTFDKAGTYRLICRQHSLNGMSAQITVQ